ncbi:MAG TPA: GntR family transcriptional regulator [Solirubrobacterales bacterium]|nr:GntR family transcriptional regulator [Solirubrobacterales bacterium]
MSSEPSDSQTFPRLSKQPGRVLYRQVADDLVARAADGKLAPGERLPPEAQLAEAYGVNRLTIRRALEDLARAGVVRTEHGVGTFVSRPPTRHRIDDGEASLSESMERRGLAVRHHVLAITEEEDPGTDGPFPDFPGGVVRFRFVRYLEEEPWSIGEALLPAALAPSDWDGDRSVFAAVTAEHGLTVKRAERAFSAGPADPEEAGWLQVPVGAALLDLRGFNTDDDGRVIATIAHRIRGDRAEYVVGVAG